MRHSIVKLALPLLGLLATGCANMTMELGPTDSSANPVNFSLKSSDTVSGSMNATVPDGEPSSADFF